MNTGITAGGWQGGWGRHRTWPTGWPLAPHLCWALSALLGEVPTGLSIAMPGPHMPMPGSSLQLGPGVIPPEPTGLLLDQPLPGSLLSLHPDGQWHAPICSHSCARRSLVKKCHKDITGQGYEGPCHTLLAGAHLTGWGLKPRSQLRP